MNSLPNQPLDSSRNTVLTVAELRDLLGQDVVLLGWPKGSKGTPKKWGHLTTANMTPAYLRKLQGRNIGVALGRVSGGLVALDVDDDALVPLFIAANPFLNDTLQTHGARGRVFWLRMDGAYPEKTVKLKSSAGVDVGEFRCGKNSQSIIHGIHPSGKPYEMLNKAKPLLVKFESIVWPAGIKNPPTLETELLANDTEKQSYRETESQSNRDTDETDGTEAIVVGGCVVRSIEHAVDLAMPNRVHQNNDCLFTLARAVKALELQSGKFTPTQLRDVFHRWYVRATPFLRKEQSRDEYLTQFLNAYASAKYALGESPVTQAWKLAQEKPLPPEAVEYFDDADKRHVVALCRELQIIAGREPFYLSARTVQHLLNHADHIKAARWLQSFRVLKIIDEVKKGVGEVASRYRYRGKTE